MIEIKSMSYEECRAEHFKELMKKMQRKIDWWQDKARNSLGPVSILSRAHHECSEAGIQYNFYNDALEALENQPKWISVEERLPEEMEDVLILVKETEFYGVYKEFSKSYFCQYVGQYDGEWYTVYCHGHRYIADTAKQPNADKLEVTHWMPLPEPPKEG